MFLLQRYAIAQVETLWNIRRQKQNLSAPWDLVRKAEVTLGQGLKGEIGGSQAQKKRKGIPGRGTHAQSKTQSCLVGWGVAIRAQVSCPAPPSWLPLSHDWASCPESAKGQIPTLHSQGPLIRRQEGHSLCALKSGLRNHECPWGLFSKPKIRPGV